MGFDDAKALTVDNLLRSTMIGEELVILGGNTSLQLGQTPTPAATAVATGGTLAAATYSVIVTALTLDGYIQVGGTNNGTVGEQVTISAITTATFSTQISRTNMDASTDTYGGGVAKQSTAASVVCTGTTSTISATVADVPGASAYMWFWGAAGSEVLGAVTTINSVSITATATGTYAATSLGTTDYSTNSLVFDGLLTQLSKSLGSYYKVLATGTAGTGTPLTSDGAGGIKEINDAFASFWNLYRLSPSDMYVNAQEAVNINSKVIAGGGAPLFRFNMDANGEVDITGGVVVGSMINKITSRKVKITTHPNVPPGQIVFYSEDIPYPLAGIREILTIRCRYDYRAIEWPQVRRRHEYGVYFDGVMQNYFLPAFGLIKNIANG
jgi:hypothetical protein